uniref:Uncharacterized protein n=1 Tax=candidate division WOR-3 bacterium TaxID=2052148 RepID=A0A7V3ZW46_UNCW3
MKEVSKKEAFIPIFKFNCPKEKEYCEKRNGIPQKYPCYLEVSVIKMMSGSYFIDIRCSIFKTLLACGEKREFNSTNFDLQECIKKFQNFWSQKDNARKGERIFFD